MKLFLKVSAYPTQVHPPPGIVAWQEVLNGGPHCNVGHVVHNVVEDSIRDAVKLFWGQLLGHTPGNGSKVELLIIQALVDQLVQLSLQGFDLANGPDTCGAVDSEIQLYQ